jgi:hypothetical protein
VGGGGGWCGIVALVAAASVVGPEPPFTLSHPVPFYHLGQSMCLWGIFTLYDIAVGPSNLSEITEAAMESDLAHGPRFGRPFPFTGILLLDPGELGADLPQLRWHRGSGRKGSMRSLSTTATGRRFEGCRCGFREMGGLGGSGWPSLH